MSSRAFRMVVISVAVACVPVAGPRGGAGEARLPVRWNAHSLLEGLPSGHPSRPGDFSAVLSSPWDSPLDLVVGTADAHRDVTVRDCAELMAIPKEDVWSTKTEPIGTERAWRVTCGALSRMARARSARVSHLPFALEALLPALADLDVTKGASSDAGYFRELRRRSEIQCSSKARCIIRTPTDQFAIDLLAAGDFNGDGVEDIIGQSSAGPIAGTAVATRGFVVTRQRPGGALTLLEWW